MKKGIRFDPARRIKAPLGTHIQTKSWLTEALLRMLMNNLSTFNDFYTRITAKVITQFN